MLRRDLRFVMGIERVSEKRSEVNELHHSKK